MLTQKCVICVFFISGDCASAVIRIKFFEDLFTLLRKRSIMKLNKIKDELSCLKFFTHFYLNVADIMRICKRSLDVIQKSIRSIKDYLSEPFLSKTLLKVVNSVVKFAKKKKMKRNSLLFILFFILHFLLKFLKRLAFRKFQTTSTFCFLDEFLHLVLVIRMFS